MEDKRAHERIDSLENVMKNHIESHSLFEKNLNENTILTRQIADNTGELVAIVKGAKGLRKLIIWVTPIVVAMIASLQWLRNH